MLAKLKKKRPDALVTRDDMAALNAEEKFDYIFITSGSVSLFTEDEPLKKMLRSIRGALCRGGLFVFAVDTIACVEPDDDDYLITARARIDARRELVLRTKNRFNAQTKTQFSPGIYELTEDGEPIEVESMDFQTHLHSFREMDGILDAAGFEIIGVYSSFDKKTRDGKRRRDVPLRMPPEGVNDSRSCSWGGAGGTRPPRLPRSGGPPSTQPGRCGRIAQTRARQ